MSQSCDAWGYVSRREKLLRVVCQFITLTVAQCFPHPQIISTTGAARTQLVFAVSYRSPRTHVGSAALEELDLEQEIRSSASVDCIFVISDCNSDLETSPIPGPISICTWLLKQDPSRLDS